MTRKLSYRNKKKKSKRNKCKKHGESCFLVGTVRICVDCVKPVYEEN